MKKLIKIIFVFVIFFSAVVVGTWVLSQFRDLDSVVEKRMKQCVDLADNISKEIIAANYCRSDSECRATNIRCPWGEGEGWCRHIVINKNHSVALLQKDAISYVQCMNNDENLKTKFNYCFTNVENKCPDLTKINFKCVENKCVEAE